MRAMDDELITLARFPSVGAAEAARMCLEAAGIPALISERDALRLDPFQPTRKVGIRLQVRAADADEARDILALEEA